MSVNDTWMPLYLGDYLADTMHLNAAQHGAYLLLLMHYWRNGPLPDDDAQLAAIARCDARLWKTVGPVVRGFFRPNNGVLHQKRMDQERARAGSKFEAKSTAGTAGANGKWKRDPAMTEQATLTRSQRLAEARKKGSHTDVEWSNMLEICDRKCVRCGARTEDVLCKDHIIPLYRGGSDAIENIQPLCRSCNSQKGPETIDHRPRGWREKMPEMPGKTPGKMPNGALAECLADACRMPGELEKEKESSLSEGFVQPREQQSGDVVAAVDEPEIERSLEGLPPGIAAIAARVWANPSEPPPPSPPSASPDPEPVEAETRTPQQIANALGRSFDANPFVRKVTRNQQVEQLEASAPTRRPVKAFHLTPEQRALAYGGLGISPVEPQRVRQREYA
jgi:uncharacterized protein YdaU (DUF1376 family)